VPGAAFTVVMPAYNAERSIGPAIRSVLAQTRGDFELVVVDDGSTDGTADVAGSFADPRVRLVRQENLGLAAARNVGAARGDGQFVALLDSDDLWLPTFLEQMGSALAGDPTAGFAYTDAWVLDDRTRRIARATAMRYQDPPESPPADPEELLRALLRRNFVFTAATVRRSVFEGVGGYDGTLRASEDYELWLRIAANGYRAVRAEGILAVYRKRAASLSTDVRLMLTSEREVFRLVAEEYEVEQPVRDLAAARKRVRDVQIASLNGERTALGLAYEARKLVVGAKNRVLAPLAWRRVAPPEVAAAFPDLKTV